MLTLPVQLLGILSALGAAAAWGGGDFAGGFATRRNHPILVLGLNSSAGCLVLTVLALLRREGLISQTDVIWAVSAGIFGGLGLVSLYRGLALGSSAVVSPLAAVVGAAIPVLAGGLLEGLPSLTQIAGFTLGLAGIWQVTRPPESQALQDESAKRRSVWREASTWLALVAGVGFGLFFTFLGQISSQALFAPLVATKVVQVVFAVLLVSILRLKMGDRAGLPQALFAGILDAGGNTFFVLAQNLTRLDVAAVLSSMYPLGTVLCSRLLLKEHISRSQWLGALLCVGAVGLIAL